MTLVAVDVGNSRLKWGWQTSAGSWQMHALPLHAAPLQEPFGLPCDDLRWVMAGSNPTSRDAFAEVVRQWGDEVQIIRDYRDIPITVDLENPAGVGVDRLLNAVGAFLHLHDASSGAVVIDAGTAVTVDLVLPRGVFAGGTILPGPRLMFDSLHRHTAKLPNLAVGEVPNDEAPGKSTEAAMRAGITAALVGGVQRIIDGYLAGATYPVQVFATGGALGALSRLPGVTTVPHLTLDGIYITALHLP